jgi:hypothetical protein
MPIGFGNWQLNRIRSVATMNISRCAGVNVDSLKNRIGSCV